jgi:hypothetical protein
MQRVDFEPIAGTRFDQYVGKLRVILSFLQQPGNNKFKVFRDFARKQGMWEKERAPVLFSLVDVVWDKTTVKVGKTAKKLMQARSDQDFQQALFDRLREVNILLVKYVLEALDVQQGGRLHSIHELYRMITSYVYPGKYITLTAFQAWVDWLAASGVIKLIGIRWGLSERGQKLVPELRAMDLDEILEDMEDADAEGDDDGDDGDGDEDEADEEAVAAPTRRATSAAEAAPRAPARPEPKAAPASTRGGDFSFDDESFDEEDLFSDLPPEAVPPSDDAVTAAASRFGLEDDDLDEAAPARRPLAKPAVKHPPEAPAPAARPVAKAAELESATARPTTAPSELALLRAPLAAPSVRILPAAAFDTRASDNAAVLAQLRAWHALFGGWPALDAASLGVSHAPEAGDRAVLVELGVLAVLVEGADAEPRVFAFVRRLREAEFLTRLLAPGAAHEALEAAADLGEEAWARGRFERLVHAPAIARRAAERWDLLHQLRQATSGAAAIDLIRDGLVGRSWREAPFFVLRELVRLGLVDTAAAREAVVVPTARLARNAAELGLATTGNLSDFKSLMALSATASALVGGADLGYGLALERADLGFG